MGLTSWTASGDFFAYTQLADDWGKVDVHDHTFGKGKQIPTGGLADGAVVTVKLADGTVTRAKIANSVFDSPDFVNAIHIDGTITTLDMRDTSAGSNLKRSRLLVTAGHTYLQSINDAYSSITHVGLDFNHSTGQSTVSGYDIVPEGWHVVGAGGEPAFGSGWASSIPVKFYRHLGTVHVAGAALHGAGAVANATIFTLPAGYRPGQSVSITVPALDGSFSALIGRCEVTTGGIVRVGESITTAYLDGISFRAEA